MHLTTLALISVAPVRDFILRNERDFEGNGHIIRSVNDGVCLEYLLLPQRTSPQLKSLGNLGRSGTGVSSVGCPLYEKVDDCTGCTTFYR
jgi:hypothetical protein